MKVEHEVSKLIRRCCSPSVNCVRIDCLLFERYPCWSWQDALTCPEALEEQGWRSWSYFKANDWTAEISKSQLVFFPTSDWVHMKVEHELSKLIQKFPPSVNCMIIDCLFGGCYHIINLTIILDWLSGHWACHVDARPAAQTHPQARIIIAFDLDVGHWTCHFEIGPVAQLHS